MVDNAEELCMNLYYFFKNNPYRREDLFEIEETLDLEELVLLCHTQCRWLSLIPALQRLTKSKGSCKETDLMTLEEMIKTLERMTSTWLLKEDWSQKKFGWK